MRHIVMNVSAITPQSPRRDFAQVSAMESSWAYEGDGTQDGLPAWQMALIGADVVLAAALVGCEVLVLRGYKRRISS